MIRTTNSLLVAQAVMSLVNLSLPDNGLVESNFWVESYSNGREQGLAISHISGHQIAFAENRNSDSIVVYVGMHFSMQGNVPTKDAYEARTLFTYNKHLKAAEFIVQQMQKIDSEWETAVNSALAKKS